MQNNDEANIKCIVQRCKTNDCDCPNKQKNFNCQTNAVSKIYGLNIKNLITISTSSWQYILAMASDRRIILSSCRTVIRQADLVAPV